MSFILSKIFWTLVSPGNVLVLVLLLAGFLATANHKGWQKLGQKLTFNIALLLFFIAIFPVGNWALTPLENAFPMSMPEHVDGIILLGGDENSSISTARDQPTFYDSANRYLRFIELAHKYPEAKLLYTGGSGNLVTASPMKESEIAHEELKRVGLPVDQIVFEDTSRNTFENATKLASIVHPTAQQNWLLITNAWHMPRSVGSFRKAGWKVYPQPTGYLTTGLIYSTPHFDLLAHLKELTIAIHEYLGLIAYRVTGRTDQLWPH